jgi:hypothetical protein
MHVAKHGTHTNSTCDLQVGTSSVTFTGHGVSDYDNSPSKRSADEVITPFRTSRYAMQLLALAATERGTLLRSNVDP